LAPYRQVFAALQVAPGTSLEVQTEYGDRVTAQRRADGAQALYDTNTKLPVRSDDRGLGVVSQLNNSEEMRSHLDLFHATESRLRQRAASDASLIALARTPLDQLFALASKITADEAALSETRTRRSDLSDTIREREEREQSLEDRIEENSDGARKIQRFTVISIVLVIIGLAVAFLVTQLAGAAICALGLVVAAGGHILNRKVESAADVEGQAIDIQLGRVDELFNTHTLSRSRRDAEESLAESVAQWRAIVGNIKPTTLLTDRPRIEELASHLRVIDNEDVAPADTSVLVGFASMLAELNRRFPAERVPILVDDLFPQLAPQYHGALPDLILRASHRRQVIVETGDLSVAKWAAVEAVGGDALLLSDFDIDVEPIINQAVAVESH